MPRVGLYSPWSGNMDEGWARFVFDTFGVPYVTVRNEMVRAGNLNEFLDVLVIPSSEHSMDRDLRDRRLIDWVRERGHRAHYVLSLERRRGLRYRLFREQPEKEARNP